MHLHATQQNHEKQNRIETEIKTKERSSQYNENYRKKKKQECHL